MITKVKIAEALTVMACNYKDIGFQMQDEVKSKILISLWYDYFKNYECKDFFIAVKDWMSGHKESPTVAEIKKALTNYVYMKNVSWDNGLTIGQEMELEYLNNCNKNDIKLLE